MDILAHHYKQTDIHLKAIEYLTLAGERSLEVYALNEAEARLQEAYDLAVSVGPQTAILPRQKGQHHCPS